MLSHSSNLLFTLLKLQLLEHRKHTKNTCSMNTINFMFICPQTKAIFTCIRLGRRIQFKKNSSTRTAK